MINLILFLNDMEKSFRPLFMATPKPMIRNPITTALQDKKQIKIM
jgi:hypothetical protein